MLGMALHTSLITLRYLGEIFGEQIGELQI